MFIESYNSCKLHLVDRTGWADGFVHYETGNTHSREQKRHFSCLVCMKCGGVIFSPDNLLEEPEERICLAAGFALVGWEMRFYGYV